MNKILQKYKKDLKKFIEKNNLDKENFSDIEERINEKLSKIKNPTESDIKNILHEIGTPEEIFAEELGEKMIKEPKNLWEKIMQKTEKVIFLGVFYELGQKTGISGNIYRIMFLFLFAVGFVAGVVEIMAVLIISYIFGFLLLRTGIFGFLFSLGLGFLFTLLLIPSVILFGMYLVDFHVENIYPFMNITTLFPIGMIIGIFSLILFIAYFFRYAFTGTFFKIGFLLTAIISFFIAISIGFSLIIGIFYSSKEIKTEVKISSEIGSRDYVFHPYILSSGYAGNNFNETKIFGEALWRSYAYQTAFDLSLDEKIHFIIEKRYFGLPGGEKNFNISEIKLNEFNEGKIFVNMPKEKFPLGFVDFEVKKILVPKNFVFSFPKNTMAFPLKKEEINIKNSEKYKKEEIEKIQSFCDFIYFDENKKIFCDINKNQIKEVLKQKNEN